MPTPIAIGVMVYNEEANIARLLDSILSQSDPGRIARIVVVASGCADRSCEIVETYATHDDRIKLVAEGERGGKVRAINAFLTGAPEPLLLVSGADMIYGPNTVAAITKPFEDPDIGMVGSHPIPLNSKDTFVGFAVNLLWRLHHEVSLVQPKMGELIAFRNVFRGLDPDTLADEVQIEHGIRAVGYKVAYAPDAVVYNRGPETVPEFVAQRSRWVAHNLQVQRKHRYPIATWQASTLARAAVAVWKADHPRLDWFLGTAALEVYCRLKGMFDYPALHVKHGRLWKPQATTKVLVRDGDTSNGGPVAHVTSL
jgi:cellulose synthase/poly-beta-1,6-N-acetylglucosamine synthase-like glycosyltransferase